MSDASKVKIRTACLDDAGRIALDVPCRMCRYNLRRRDVDDVCPECGTPVRASLDSSLLMFSDPRWLRRLFCGVIWSIVGLAMFVIPHAIILAIESGLLLRNLRQIFHIPSMIALIATVPFMLGIGLLTGPERGACPTEATGKANLRKRLAQPLAFLAVALILLTTVGPAMWIGPDLRQLLILAVAIGLTLIGGILLFSDVATLLRRLPDHRLLAHGTVVLFVGFAAVMLDITPAAFIAIARWFDAGDPFTAWWGPQLVGISEAYGAASSAMFVGLSIWAIVLLVFTAGRLMPVRRLAQQIRSTSERGDQSPPDDSATGSGTTPV